MTDEQTKQHEVKPFELRDNHLFGSGLKADRDFRTSLTRQPGGMAVEPMYGEKHPIGGDVPDQECVHPYSALDVDPFSNLLTCEACGESLNDPNNVGKVIAVEKNASPATPPSIPAPPTVPQGQASPDDE